MPEIPEHPKIYHITHINNLEGILKDGVLWSDAKRLKLGLGSEIVGMSAIKKARLEEVHVKCYPETMVGEYVPFYFCSRSIMLYILYKGNHPDITYRGGQEPIMHLQADLRATIEWAEKQKVRWAFSDCNARERIANFYNDISKLSMVDWTAVAATDWRDILIQEGKQAEFLVYEAFPWQLVEKIGVNSKRIKDAVIDKIGTEKSDMVTVEKSWYY